MEWWGFVILMIVWDIVRALGTAYITARKVKRDRDKDNEKSR